VFIREELDRYLYWQVERENIRIQKEVSKLPPPWTDDSILQQYKFCQVFREEDRTTKQDKWVTGAYIVKSPNGMDKVTGVAECISHMWERKNYLIDKLEEAIEQDKCSLEYCWKLLRDYPYMGPFMAYEVVTDLRFTYLLSAANDKLTWANAGPGAMRGLNRLTGRPLDFCQRSHDWCSEMVALYDIALERLPVHITFRNDLPYELREIEGGLCEFDKYSRIYKGEGRTRSIYKYDEELPLVEEI
jgi:hypothetical protein